MGILKHYEVINPFISNTTDALNRLKPGFEAPIAIVTSLGGTTKTDPSRNRTVLIGLIKEVTSPLATRFELRSPNPLSNSYLYVAACIQAMLDGIRYVVEHDLSAEACEKAISKAKGETVPYLEAGRMYRSESNVFETFTAEEREALFGKSPRTVWENIRQLDEQKEKRLVLLKTAFSPNICSPHIKRASSSIGLKISSTASSNTIGKPSKTTVSFTKMNA